MHFEPLQTGAPAQGETQTALPGFIISQIQVLCEKSGIVEQQSQCIIGGTFFIERSTLLHLKGFRNILLGTDSDLFERALIAGVNMKETGIPTYIYHHETEDSITNMLLSKNTETEIIFNEPNPDI